MKSYIRNEQTKNKIMSLNLLLEIILLLFVILAFNGIIYSLTLFNLNAKNSNSSENISVRTNSSEKDISTPTLLLASTHLRITSSDSSASETSSVTSLDSSASETLYETSSETLSETSFETLSENSIETNLSETLHEISAEDILAGFELTEDEMRRIYDPIIINPWAFLDSEVYAVSLDSITELNRANYEQWRAISGDLHDLPRNTPYDIIRQVKFEEINILYSQDLILFSITQTELRLIIEQLAPLKLWALDVNHFILNILAYYHT